MVGAWLSATVTKNILATVPHEFVAKTVTGVVPLKKVCVADIGNESQKNPILYCKVGAGDPVTVTLDPSVTDALHALKSVGTVRLVTEILGVPLTAIDFVALFTPQLLVTE